MKAKQVPMLGSCGQIVHPAAADQPNDRVAGSTARMKTTVVVRQRTSIKPSLPEAQVDASRRGPRADRAETDLLRQAARRMVLSRRASR
jgi:hypothetical protein